MRAGARAWRERTSMSPRPCVQTPVKVATERSWKNELSVCFLKDPGRGAQLSSGTEKNGRGREKRSLYHCQVCWLQRSSLASKPAELPNIWKERQQQWAWEANGYQHFQSLVQRFPQKGYRDFEKGARRPAAVVRQVRETRVTR